MLDSLRRRPAVSVGRLDGHIGQAMAAVGSRIARYISEKGGNGICVMEGVRDAAGLARAQSTLRMKMAGFGSNVTSSLESLYLKRGKDAASA